MIARMFKCKHCGRLVKRNPRIKGSQRYCGRSDCQQARKNTWERLKIKTDESYRHRRLASKKRWRKQHCAHAYQYRYREKHPEYVSRNREKQKNRGDSDRETKVVKTDALLHGRPINCGLYALLPWDKSKMKKIVKTDALMVQLTVLQSVQALSPL
jgi:hypothetical protein